MVAGRVMEEAMGNIVTAKELSQYLKLSESTVYQLAAKGELPGFKIGNSWRFDMGEVLRVIKRKKVDKNLKEQNERGGKTDE